MERRPRYHAVAILALATAYIAFRVAHDPGSCLWFDEIFSVHAAEHSWTGLFDFVAKDLIHPPLFYVLLKGWITLGGESLTWLRTFPIVFAAAALIPFYLLTRELKLSPTAAGRGRSFICAQRFSNKVF